MKVQKTLQMVQTALFSGILCVLSPIALPVPGSPVPLSLATFAVYLTGMILGAKKGVLSVLVYLLLGVVGLPVFSGFSGGIGVLLGPTGGYLLGYIPCVLIIGLLADYKIYRKEKLKTDLIIKNKNSFKMALCCGAGMSVGTVFCYLVGTAWFMCVMDGSYSFVQALMVCVAPYMAFDVVKIVAAVAIGVPLQRLLRSRESSFVYGDFR